MIARLLLIATLSGLLLSACGSEGESESVVNSEIESAVESSIELENTRWQLVELVALGGHSFVPDDPSDYTLVFRPEGRLTGKSDCNTFTAQWATNDNALAFTDYSSTRSLCIRGSLHNYYSLYLREVTDATADANELALVTSTPGVRLTFQATE